MVVSDGPGAALAGAAMVRAVPPTAADPNTKATAVLAKRVLVLFMTISFLLVVS